MGEFISDIFGGESTERQPTGFQTLPGQVQDAALDDFLKQVLAVTGGTGAFQPPPITPETQLAIDQLGALPGGRQVLPQFQQGQFRPDFKFGQRSSAALGEVGGQIGQAGANIQAGTQQISPEELLAAISGFQDPFEEQIVQSAFGDIRDEQARQASGIAGLASQRGAFGGTRQALLESELGRSTQRTLGEVGGALRSQGFQSAASNALAQLTGERGRFLQGAGLNLGQAGAQTALGNQLFQNRLGVQQIQSQRLQDTVANLQARTGAQQAQAGGILAGQDILRQQQVGEQQVPLQQLAALQNFLQLFTGIAGGGDLLPLEGADIFGDLVSAFTGGAKTGAGGA